jgi:hypothetical protein
MSDPEKPGYSTQFHTTIYGGQQAMGSHNAKFVQYNTANAAQAAEFAELVRTLKDNLNSFTDPPQASREIKVVEDVAADRAPDRSPVLAALQRLAALATAGTAVAEAIAKAQSLVTRFWPF